MKSKSTKSTRCRRYCTGDVQPIPRGLATGAAYGDGYGPAQLHGALGWFWLRDRRHPGTKSILGPLRAIQWLVRELNAAEARR